MLAENVIHLEPVTVSVQKREQQILDVPKAITVIGATTIEQSNITELGQMSEFIPVLYIREQGVNRPDFVMRGLTSNEVKLSRNPKFLHIIIMFQFPKRKNYQLLKQNKLLTIQYLTEAKTEIFFLLPRNKFQKPRIPIVRT